MILVKSIVTRQNILYFGTSILIIGTFCQLDCTSNRKNGHFSC